MQACPLLGHYIYPDTCSLKAGKDGKERVLPRFYSTTCRRHSLDQRVPTAQVSKTGVLRRGFANKGHLVKTMAFLIVIYRSDNWTIKKLSARELMVLNCGVGEDASESLGLQRDQTS